jgi:hypothetical protein
MSNKACIADLTGEGVLYRDLRPCDERLPGIADLRAALGLPTGYLPRKRERDYARVMLPIMQAAQQQRGAAPLTDCLVIGDTENDSLLASYLAELAVVRSYGFIGVDQPGEIAQLRHEGVISYGNRWALLRPWAEQLAEQGAHWPTTALLIDIDKTLLGPRGRTDKAIDDARAAGAMAVAHALFGGALDQGEFRSVYDQLCQKRYHPFTLDNQDYVVYSALLIAGGTLSLADLDENLRVGRINSFADLLAASATEVPAPLTTLHGLIRERVAEGDPTPFKQFRSAELAETIDRMANGQLTLCAEIYSLAQDLIAQGALCLAASDKPAEASLPSAAQRAQGMLPLHQTLAIVD